MTKKADQVISIRVPAGLPDELRALTGVPFSTMARSILISFLNNERRKVAAAKAAAEERDAA